MLIFIHGFGPEAFGHTGFVIPSETSDDSRLRYSFVLRRLAGQADGYHYSVMLRAAQERQEVQQLLDEAGFEPPQGVRLEVGQRYRPQRLLVRRRQHDRRRDARLQCLLPATHAQAPPVARRQAGEAVRRNGRREVVAARGGEGQKPGRHHGADDVRAVVREAEELPRSLAMRRGEAVRLQADDFVVDAADSQFVAVEYGGTLVALAEGDAEVRPVVGGVVGEPIRIQVTGSPVSSLRVDGAPVNMEVGQGARMRAVAYRLDFSVDDVTQTAVWTSSNPDVIRVDDAGQVVTLAEGVAVIDAWVDGRVGRSGIIRVETR